MGGPSWASPHSDAMQRADAFCRLASALAARRRDLTLHENLNSRALGGPLMALEARGSAKCRPRLMSRGAPFRCGEFGYSALLLCNPWVGFQEHLLRCRLRVVINRSWLRFAVFAMWRKSWLSEVWCFFPGAILTSLHPLTRPAT